MSCAAPSPPLLKLTNSYGSFDNNGTIRTSSIDTGGGTISQTFAHDEANRIQSFTDRVLPSGVERRQDFQYDGFANVWSDNTTTGLVPLTANGPNWYATANGVTNRLNYGAGAYDAAGNLKQLMPASTTSRVAGYDVENRMTKIRNTATQPMDELESSDYDAEGRRVRRTASGKTTRYVYDVSGELVAEYVERTNPGIVAPITPPPTRQYVFADHLGSTRLVTDVAGGCVKRTDYQPFGAEIPRTADLPGPTLACYGGAGAPAQMFTGQMRDGETGLDYFGARYFSGAQGRFTSPDKPFIDQFENDPQSWNLYGYVRNNPLTFVDPNGEDCIYTNDFAPKIKQPFFCKFA